MSEWVCDKCGAESDVEDWPCDCADTCEQHVATIKLLRANANRLNLTLFNAEQRLAHARTVPGIVGRYVMHKFMRWGPAREVEEPCEVVACEYAAEYSWRLLIATQDGYLFSKCMSDDLHLVSAPSSDGGPYR